jgi:lipopolysaccharide transport system ATP-binding protein
MDRGSVSIVGIGKQYEIGLQKPGTTTLREALRDLALKPIRRLRNPGSSSGHTTGIWALRGVSAEIAAGEVVGIIGRNGAGKSTLLKILSRITEPSEGEVVLRGRVGSLLEVGTGFHQELSGRENILLNGAILGMSRAEVRRQLDEIVEFAEIGKYLDTPVKRYSSGMYVRLAFAVAAYLQADILLVDEVLAVGDFAFQRKCLGKMSEVSREGRTVLFVSHNMASVSALCQRAILLDGGEVVDDGPVAGIVDRYIRAGGVAGGQIVWPDVADAPGNEVVRLCRVSIVSGGHTTADVDIMDDVTIEIEFRNFVEGSISYPAIQLLNAAGVGVLSSAPWPSASLSNDGWYGKPQPVGVLRSRCVVPGCFLNEGLFTVNVYMMNDVPRRLAEAEGAVAFTVHDTGYMRDEYTGGWFGVVRPKLDWATEYLTQQASD